jgi:hypothetical protein
MPATRDEAFLRLIILASTDGGDARVDALLALAQRNVFVPTWFAGDGNFRTVFSSGGISGLPVYTTIPELEEMSRRYGWLMPDGKVCYREVAAMVAMSHALSQNLLVLLNMGSEYALELDTDELRPLVANANNMTQGPFSGAGRLGASLSDVVQRRTPPPPRPTSSPGVLASPFNLNQIARLPPGYETRPAIALPNERPSSAPGENRVSLPPDTKVVSLASGTELSALATPPTDELLDALDAVLRQFPEAEWACIASVAKPPTPSVPTICLRVAENFRTRVAEIATALKTAATQENATLDVFLLDDVAATRGARHVGRPFFPWRK